MMKRSVLVLGDGAEVEAGVGAAGEAGVDVWPWAVDTLSAKTHAKARIGKTRTFSRTDICTSNRNRLLSTLQIKL
jgi:hypothetical protein